MTYYGDRCPYCNEPVEINHDDDYGLEESGVYEDYCPHCDKHFAYTTFISVNHDLTQADCLNGDEHDYDYTFTIPREYTRWRCTMCGDEKPLSAEEMDEFLKQCRHQNND
jgi:hypothetical protein